MLKVEKVLIVNKRRIHTHRPGYTLASAFGAGGTYSSLEPGVLQSVLRFSSSSAAPAAIDTAASAGVGTDVAKMPTQSLLVEKAAAATVAALRMLLQAQGSAVNF